MRLILNLLMHLSFGLFLAPASSGLIPFGFNHVFGNEVRHAGLGNSNGLQSTKRQAHHEKFSSCSDPGQDSMRQANPCGSRVRSQRCKRRMACLRQFFVLIDAGAVKAKVFTVRRSED
jgi:hypothetical protein